MNTSAGNLFSARDRQFVHDYRPEIDGLRAVAVVAVIAYHFSKDLLPGGFLGVDIFFVISGYVITRSIARHPYRSIQELALGFYSRRVKRLVPALVAFVLITCLLGALFIPPESSEYYRSLKTGTFSLFGLSNIYLFKQTTDYFGASAALNLFTHTWSLGVEEQFYLVFPALFWFAGGANQRPRGRRVLLVALGGLTLLSFAAHLWFSRVSTSGTYFMMPTRLWELSIGCIAAVAARWDRQNHDGNWLRYGPRLGGLFMAIAILAPASQYQLTTPMVVVSAAALIVTTRPGDLVFRLLTLRAVLMVGLMSYSLYLWHWSVLSISRWTVGIHWWTAPFQIALMLGLAAASYSYLEQPLRRAKWSRSEFATVGLGLMAIVSAASAIYGARIGFAEALYTGAPVQMAAKGAETLLDDKRLDDRLQWRAKDCILSSEEEVGKRIDADACALKSPSSALARHFVVIGDSYSAAEFEMYSVLSEGARGLVVATSTWGASPVREIPNKGPWSKANDYYWSKIVPQLLMPLSEGDVVIMINDLQDLTPASMGAEERETLALFKVGLDRLAAELSLKGVHIIFQTANPPIREAQCTPDMAKKQWFNLGQSSAACKYYTRAESLRRRQRLSDILKEIGRVHPNFHVLDLFPVLCSGDICEFYNRDNLCLYRDVWSHSSIEANYLLRPLFLSVVNKAIGTSTEHVRGATRRYKFTGSGEGDARRGDPK